MSKIIEDGRLFSPNFDNNYQHLYKTNPNQFKIGKGMCHGTYDRAVSYGPG